MYQRKTKTSDAEPVVTSSPPHGKRQNLLLKKCCFTTQSRLCIFSVIPIQLLRGAPSHILADGPLRPTANVRLDPVPNQYPSLPAPGASGHLAGPELSGADARPVTGRRHTARRRGDLLGSQALPGKGDQAEGDYSVVRLHFHLGHLCRVAPGIPRLLPGQRGGLVQPASRSLLKVF